VKHAKFGDGEVLEVEGDGDGTIVTVRFAAVVKRLALTYAPLSAE
jgi:DNA helicase-2/ATP-dependent DNA helicase PcrA